MLTQTQVALLQAAADGSDDHQHGILATVCDLVDGFVRVKQLTDRTIVDHGDPETAASVLSAVWAHVSAAANALSDVGHALADVAPPSPGLASIFRASAEAYARREDYRFADPKTCGTTRVASARRRRQPCQVPDRLGSDLPCPQPVAPGARLRGRAAGRSPAVRHDELAHDLRHLGIVMTEADRADTAIDYLTRARDLANRAEQPTVRFRA